MEPVRALFSTWSWTWHEISDTSLVSKELSSSAERDINIVFNFFFWLSFEGLGVIQNKKRRSTSCSQTWDWQADYQYTEFYLIPESTSAPFHLNNIIITSSTWRQQGLSQSWTTSWLSFEHSIFLKIQLSDSSTMHRAWEYIGLCSSNFGIENCKILQFNNYDSHFITAHWQEPEYKQSNVLSCKFPSVKNHSRIYNISISVWHLAVLRFIISTCNRLSSAKP